MTNNLFNCGGFDSKSSLQYWKRHPNYSVLVDTRDRMEPQTTYVAEENIETVIDTKVILH
jgi:hemimethylated DNA binding protein